MNLENLHGYLKFPSGFPAAAVRLDYVDYPRVAEGFVPRQLPSPDGAPPPAAPAAARSGASGATGAGGKTGGAAPAGNPDGGQGIPVDPPIEEGGARQEKVLAPKPAGEDRQDEAAVENAAAWLNARLPATAMPAVAQAETTRREGSGDVAAPAAAARTRKAVADGKPAEPGQHGGERGTAPAVPAGRPAAGATQSANDADLSQQELRLAFVTRAEVEHHHHAHDHPHSPSSIVPDGLADSMGIGD